MATAIGYNLVTSETPAVYNQVDYDYWREGNNACYTIYVRMRLESRNYYRNNRWACRVWLNGNLVVDNGTVKAVTSGYLGTGWYTHQSGTHYVATNSGSLGLSVQLVDTGHSSSWSINQDWGTRSGSVAVPGVSAPSAPSSISIPGSVAPDKTAYISWGAASGGTNGVSSYDLQYSKDGGSTWSGIGVGNVTNYTLDLGSLGFVQGSVLKCRVIAYTSVNGANFYSDWTTSGNTTTLFNAPSIPSSITIPGPMAPDQSATISWSAASGGTNGVNGYELAWSKDGGTNWNFIDVGNVLSKVLNLNSLGFTNNTVLKCAIRSYTIGQGTKYNSDWKFSSNTSIYFTAPGVVKSPAIVSLAENILTATYKATWAAPDTGGSNGVSGYTIAFYKNNVWIKDIDVGNVLSYNFNLADLTTFAVGDTIKIGIYAYTIGQSNKYYSTLVNSNIITIISDKYIYASINGGSFTKYKAFISVNGGSFIEIKKEKFEVI